MRTGITKVKKKARNFSDKIHENPVDWQMVLADIRADIDLLTTLAQIVERKIERGEPWSGDKSAALQPALSFSRGSG
jgi:hypothetical protein